MSGPVQVIPQGLLGFLQLKQQGANPSELLGTVQATLNLEQWYKNRQVIDLSASAITEPTATPGGSIPFSPQIVVPQGFTWWVENYTLRINLLAAETIRIAGSTVPQGGSNAYLLGVDVADTVTARARLLMWSARDFWLQPGQALSVAVFDDLTAANITINGTVRGIQIPI